MNSLWFKAARFGNLGLIKLMLRNGADPNIKNKNGDTALHWASLYKRKDIVKLLLQNGADPNIKDMFDETSLYWASLYKCKDIVKLLKQYGAKYDLNTKP